MSPLKANAISAGIPVMSNNSPRVGCGAVLLRGDELLLIQRLKEPEAGCWSLVGGKVEWQDTVEETIIRETQEEVGVTIRALSLLTVVDLMNADHGYHWVSPIYLVEAFEGDATLMEPDKHGAVGWFPLDALPQPLAIGVQAAVSALSRRASSSRVR